MSDRTLMIATLTGRVSRRTRFHIEHAPVGVVVRVMRLPNEIGGAAPKYVIFDELESWPETKKDTPND
jgi:hypothetical protein